MSPELVPTLVLHRRRYGETGLLLELFTLTQGRVPVIARGAASPRSRRRGLLQPFVPLRVAWRGRGEVGTLTTVEADGVPMQLSGRVLYAGLYLNELLTRLLPRGDAAPQLFHHYRQALDDLASGGDLEGALRRFEMRLLEDLGYAPDLGRQVDGTPVVAEGRYRCEPGSGVTIAGDSGPETLSGETLLALAEGRLPASETLRREARQLMRRLLAPHLGERPLKSRELFRTMRAVSRTPGNSR
ncbi:MAG TPA: DNA repair protein RecO [Thiolapillus brandeum]|uniref:DNA repair protein RecO n=1 Tax=Thiolapillus brandeum TaxID=1076588 RepID=A0A7C5IZ24_9GAMM|nr:DNA repair protein RecO [Thiolapillus brandeum]